MITITHLNTFDNHEAYNYRLIEKDIYLDLNDTCGFSMYRMMITVHYQDDLLQDQIERKIEDVLVYIEKKQTCHHRKLVHYILGGDLEDLKDFKNKIQQSNILLEKN